MLYLGQPHSENVCKPFIYAGLPKFKCCPNYNTLLYIFCVVFGTTIRQDKPRNINSHYNKKSTSQSAFLCHILNYQIRLLGIKQLSASIGIGSSHIQIMPPFPRFKAALSITLYFLTSRRSGAALFFISNG